MNPFSWVIAHTVARRLLRECPECRHKQTVPGEKRHEEVRCDQCGAAIPPPADDR
jgi:ribosomal protein S27E